MMRRARLVSIGSAAIAVLLGWLAASSPAAFAETDSRQEMAVIVVDSASVREAEQAIPLTLSLIGLLATQQDGSEVVFVDTGRPGEAIGPFRTSDSDYSSTRSEVVERLEAEGAPTAQSIVEAIDEARSALSDYGAPAGSAIYVALGSAGVVQYDELSYTVVPLLDKIAEQEWTIHGLSLEASDQNAAQFMDTISRSTGGRVFDLTSGADLKPLANHVFGGGVGSAIQEYASETLVDSPWSTSSIAIMPGTEETTLYLFKEGSAGVVPTHQPFRRGGLRLRSDGVPGHRDGPPHNLATHQPGSRQMEGRDGGCRREHFHLGSRDGSIRTRP